jgi:hypothetical protein
MLLRQPMTPGWSSESQSGRAGLAPFPPAPVPPQFELPDLSGTEQSSDSGRHSRDSSSDDE